MARRDNAESLLAVPRCQSCVILRRLLAHPLLFRIHVDGGDLQRCVPEHLLQHLERHARRRGLGAERVLQRMRRGPREPAPIALGELRQLLDQPTERSRDSSRCEYIEHKAPGNAWLEGTGRRPKQSCHRLRSKNVTSEVDTDAESENCQEIIGLRTAK